MISDTRLAYLRFVGLGLLALGALTVGRTGTSWDVTARILNEGYLDTSTEQARLIRLAKPVELRLDLPPGARTADPRTVAFPFLRGMRGSAFETPYDVTWRVEAPAGARLTVVLRSEQAGTDRRAVTLTDSKTGTAGDQHN